MIYLYIYIYICRAKERERDQYRPPLEESWATESNPGRHCVMDPIGQGVKKGAPQSVVCKSVV